MYDIHTIQTLHEVPHFNNYNVNTTVWIQKYNRSTLTLDLYPDGDPVDLFLVDKQMSWRIQNELTQVTGVSG